MIDIICLILYFILLFSCAYTDYKNGKIYNKYILTFLIIYMLVYCVCYIVIYVYRDVEQIAILSEKISDKMIGLLVGFIICIVFYIIGIFKGGDAKLLSIVGLHVGIKHIFYHYAVIFIVAGICAIYVMMKNKIFFKRLKRVFLYFNGMILTLKFQKYVAEKNDNIIFPFALYILIGEIVMYINILIKGLIWM